MFRYILSCPGVEKCVQESLVSPIKRSVTRRMLHKPVESLFARAEHKNTRIEAVGPSSVWSSRELGPVKEVITVPDHLSREEFKGFSLWNPCEILRTIVSASKKTHLEYCTRHQQWSLVNVTPSSGLSNRAKLTWSLLSSRDTSTTWSNAWFNWDFIGLLRPSGVTMITILREVPECLSEAAKTRAPRA